VEKKSFFGTERFLGYCRGSSFFCYVGFSFCRAIERGTLVLLQCGDFKSFLQIHSKNILNLIEISVLFFNFEAKFVIFSKNIQTEEKPSTSPEAEVHSGPRRCISFRFHTSHTSQQVRLGETLGPSTV